MQRIRSVAPLHTSFSADSSHDYIYGPSGTPIEQVSQSSGAATYLYTDQLGSVTMEADQSGSVIGAQSYSPYGSLDSSTGTDSTPFGFAGGYTDPTGLIYLINRYYDPSTGQFISVDPKVASTGTPYLYVGDNPINSKDSLGLAPNGSCGHRDLLGGQICIFYNCSLGIVVADYNVIPGFLPGSVNVVAGMQGLISVPFYGHIELSGPTVNVNGPSSTVNYEYGQSPLSFLSASASNASPGSYTARVWAAIPPVFGWGTTSGHDPEEAGGMGSIQIPPGLIGYGEINSYSSNVS